MKSSAMKIDRPDRPATYTDLGALPKNVVGEIVAGSLHVSPRPSALHARASSKLGRGKNGTEEVNRVTP